MSEKIDSSREQQHRLFLHNLAILTDPEAQEAAAAWRKKYGPYQFKGFRGISGDDYWEGRKIRERAVKARDRGVTNIRRPVRKNTSSAQT